MRMTVCLGDTLQEMELCFYCLFSPCILADMCAHALLRFLCIWATASMSQPLDIPWCCSSSALWSTVEACLHFLLILNATVHFISLCQRLFGDNFFIICFFQLKLSRCVSTFFIRPETKFQLDPTKDKEFPHRPPL